MLRRSLFLLLALLAAAPLPAAMPPGSATWSSVEIAPTWTSIYIGTVSMNLTRFQRTGSAYAASYAAKVFPYFFYNEQGNLTVNVPDEQLAALAQGKTIEFTGTAVRSDGAVRNVTGKAIPADARTGRLDVHVFYSKRIQLVFHTTYRFAGEK